MPGTSSNFLFLYLFFDFGGGVVGNSIHCSRRIPVVSATTHQTTAAIGLICTSLYNSCPNSHLYLTVIVLNHKF